MKILKIRDERVKRRWTQKQVAKLVGVQHTTIQAIETNRRKPSYEVLMKLCKLYEVQHRDIEKLFEFAS